ncbi:MAG: hypothetical protein ACJ8GV_08790 [Luteimonas sp.]
MRESIQAVRVVAIQTQLPDAHRQHVAGLCARNKEGSGLWISIQRNDLAMRVHAARVDGVGGHDISGLDHHDGGSRRIEGIGVARGRVHLSRGRT